METKYKVGDVVEHKLGMRCVIHGVIDQLKREDGMVEELPRPVYLIGYKVNDGSVEMAKVDGAVLIECAS